MLTGDRRQSNIWDGQQGRLLAGRDTRAEGEAEEVEREGTKAGAACAKAYCEADTGGRVLRSLTPLKIYHLILDLTGGS